MLDAVIANVGRFRSRWSLHAFCAADRYRPQLSDHELARIEALVRQSFDTPERGE